MKILITGANGLLGYKLVQLLSMQDDIQAIATGRRKIEGLPDHVSFHELDITNAAQTEQVISTEKPAVIINTAAMTQVDQCETERAPVSRRTLKWRCRNIEKKVFATASGN